ncbi:putative FAD-linked oxidoreductase [bacterium BMS3Abin02]|nr:putative FAD-linked oxidoreductase [bacterium BMS3Abin02]GBE21931.1 putative FAD-linked oxidoreductase [bacterium BMS3Bbin01]HDH25359.1 FAD-binding oxidoreductase [Actinomycetota bacterium]HDL48526.1 FAD-binding oxidoreductase [Actinomycetota bacterium]
MRRWNGWGDDGTDHPLSPSGAHMLRNVIGVGTPPDDAPFESVIATVPTPRLPHHPLVLTDPGVRLRHARGQSLLDWVALRSGRIGSFPDGVVLPRTEEEVREVLTWAAHIGARLIPYGGGTSVLGHINPQPDDRPVVTIDMRRINQLLHFDEVSRLATFGAGVSGPDLEGQLRARGYTLGHFPQSFEYSTLGGWVATRSSGQQSLGYGRMEDLFAGGRLEAPAGSIELPPYPASAAGPDLRQLVLGSEGRLGVLTRATVRVTRFPEREQFHGVFFPGFATGQNAIREMVQAGIPLSMLRLSSSRETILTLALAGHPRAIAAMERVFSLRKIGQAKSLLIMGFTGAAVEVRRARRIAIRIIRRHGGVNVGRPLGNRWLAGRFAAPYLRNNLWQMGYAVDTWETATDWTHVAEIVEAIEEAALHTPLHDTDERILTFTHISHVYPTGASVYTTCVFRTAAEFERTIDRARRLKRAVSETILAHGGTISHHHGVGLDHLPYMQTEKGALGVAVIGDALRRFDPDGLMNPGKLVP